MGSNHEKNGGRKSRVTFPLRQNFPDRTKKCLIFLDNIFAKQEGPVKILRTFILINERKIINTFEFKYFFPENFKSAILY